MFIPEFPENGAKLYGPPGTGKTWTMIELFKMAIEQGYSPNRMMMITYRKPMALGMASRLAESIELPGDLKKENIAKTIHSACWYPHFQALREQDPNISKIDYMNYMDWMKFSSESGHKMLPGDEDDFTQASPLYATYSQARSFKRDYSMVDLGKDTDISIELLQDVDNELQEYKRRNGKYEYCDTLDYAIDSGYVPDVDVLLVS
ncbi:UvrD-helicase domain-containing protein [Methanosarcina soligelidi]|uniref:UvrD-helicase domain-containing protein n=1 Tax=Methanosarcina soligelidi TaxID=1036677 RepID=UPI0006500116|nr:UvrD-helicase domain-containing protein [Methanosarcina soligelidi]